MLPPRPDSDREPRPTNSAGASSTQTANPATAETPTPERAQTDPVSNNVPDTAENSHDTGSTQRAANGAANGPAEGSVSDGAWLSDDTFTRTFTFPSNPGASYESAQQAFAERVRQYLLGSQLRAAESNDLAPDPAREQTSDNAAQDSLGASPTSMNFFDEILDTMLAHRPRGNGSGATQAQEASGNSGFGVEAGSAGAQDSNSPATDPATGSVSNVDGATVFTTGAPGDNPGAIVITVNYMFMDGANEPTPGRTGSLVVTIPNNATNREPQIISLFISLATRMAYSALIHNGPKPKPGITLEKFRSFKTLDVDGLADKSCSVCFEQYDQSTPEVNVEDIITTKRRKLSPTRHILSASATPEPSFAESAQIERENPPSSEAESTNTPRADASRDTPDHEPDQKVYLCDHDEEFDHTPVQMPCKHVFGRSCLAQWLKEHTSCPLCRLSVAEPDQEPARPSGIPPISYIRFGGLDDLSGGGLFNSSSEGSQQTEGNASAEPTGGEQNSSQNEDERSPPGPPTESSTLPSLLRRATLVIFNQNSRRNREVPPSPLDLPTSEPRRTRERNPHFSPVINNIQNYFRRSRRQRDANAPASDSPFSSGVSSRRTANGVETVSSDADPLRELFRSSRLFMNEFGSGSRTPRATNDGNPSGNQTLSGANQDNIGEDDEEDRTG